MNRILTQDYEFQCSGLKLPKETMITAPAVAIATVANWPRYGSYSQARMVQLVLSS
jgi:hypothetical protein